MTTLRGGAPVPSSPFPVLPLRTGTLFPGTTTTFTVGRVRSIALLHALHVGDIIGVVAQRDSSQQEPGFRELHRIGTFARVAQIARQNERAYRIVVEGLSRFELDALTETETP